MAWDNIVGQEKVKDIFQRAILNNKIAGGYLLHGIEGIGKEAIAFEFAKLLNCPNPIIDKNKISINQEFDNKYKNSIFNIQNIIYITALPSSKSTDKASSGMEKMTTQQLENIRKELEKKQIDYYYKTQIKDANQIRIGQIRELKKKLTLSNSNQFWKVIIIANAEKMSIESSNSLLKTLEEPKSNTTIILTTTNLNRILPTIKSRCQIIKCKSLSEKEIESYLRQNYDLTEINAKLYSILAQGSISKAKDYLDSDINQLREKVITLLRILLKKNTFRTEMAKLIDEYDLIKDKVIIEKFLILLIFWFKDIIILINKNQLQSELESNDNNIKPFGIINYDFIEILEKFAFHYSNADYNLIIKDIENSISQIYKNVNLNLIIYSLLIKIRNNIFNNIKQ